MVSTIQKLLMLPITLRQRRLARARQRLTASEFVQRIVDQGGDEAAAVILWNHLEDWCVADGFTPHPSDNLGWVFGLGAEELDEDLILRMLEDLHVPIPTWEFLEEFGVIDTPLRVAQLVARCRTLN
jgi:hypothetical protein